MDALNPMMEKMVMDAYREVMLLTRAIITASFSQLFLNTSTWPSWDFLGQNQASYRRKWNGSLLSTSLA